MTVAALLALLVSGLVIGLVSGLVGIGGGVLIVPLLYFVYAHPVWSGAQVAPPLEAAVAHATSLFVIVPTALRGTFVYNRAGLVAWRAVWPIAPAAVVGAVAGSQLALRLPAETLKFGFGLVLVASAAQLTNGRRGAAPRRLRLSLPVTIGTGLLVGLLSALMGIGGGIIAIPLLIHLVGLELDRVAATSLAVIAFAATAGVIAYVLTGWGRTDLPSLSLGYVHVFAGLPILVGSLLAVRWGAAINQRMRTRRLRWVFGVLFLALGVRLIVQNGGVLI